jgi:hypothetical protein
MRLENLVAGVGSSKVKQILFACAVPNLVAILYLGLFHQRAPIEVNRAILKSVTTTGSPPSDTIQVHYLMGCHSTPLSSHLHDPRTKIVPWYLDCSPECRKNPKIDCESDAFSKDPAYFMKQTYFYCDDEHETDNQTCSNAEGNLTRAKTFPDYLVCDSNDIQKMELVLASMGMKEIGRFVNGINGIQFRSDISPGDHAFSNNEFLKGKPLVSLSYDEIVLLQRS